MGCGAFSKSAPKDSTPDPAPEQAQVSPPFMSVARSWAKLLCPCLASAGDINAIRSTEFIPAKERAQKNGERKKLEESQLL